MKILKEEQNQLFCMVFKLSLFAILLFLISSCAVVDDNKFVNIGTFNIQWLGDGEKDMMPRELAEYKVIADLIAESSVDFLALQEIENAGALDLLLAHLPNYKYVILPASGNQQVAILHKHSVEILSSNLYEPLEVEPRATRPGLVVEARKGNFDWITMVVHFKSTSRYDDTPEKRERSFDLRRKQAKVVSNWADSLLKIGRENDIFVVGDFNDNPLRDKNITMDVIVDNPNLIFLTADLTSCKNPKWDVIDHIVISPSAKNRFIKNSERVVNFYSSLPAETAKRVSDHCPVITTFEITSPDND